MSNEKASELLLDSATSFDAGCLKVLQLEKELERCLELMDHLGIDPTDGTSTAERIVAMRIQGLQSEVGRLAHELNLSKKELYDLKQSLLRLGHES